jgi:uncharacterized repeat protein (TIGR03837 family)
MKRARGHDAHRWHVFCRVIDNYGDAGVTWRLARELAHEHGLDVTFFIDRLGTLARIEPLLDAARDAQVVAGVSVQRLDDHAPSPPLPDVVVEGFGAGLPAAYVEAMAAARVKPLWINLEYLSAEPWVDGAHALASQNPRLPLVRWFWFPGFTPAAGGLLRERGLFAQRDAWQATHPESEPLLRVLLFTYDNDALPALFEHWAQGDEAIECTIPEGVAAVSLDRWLGAGARVPGNRIVRGNLTVEIALFSDQAGFDRRLWLSDVNFVRGEDSFVRAQWAAKPFVWQPYRQPDTAHRDKLDAFLARYEAGLPAHTRQAVEAFWRAFNEADAMAIVGSWRPYRSELAALRRHGRAWADTLAALPELGAALVEFARRRL